jgi:hypothetical protein
MKHANNLSLILVLALLLAACGGGGGGGGGGSADLSLPSAGGGGGGGGSGGDAGGTEVPADDPVGDDGTQDEQADDGSIEEPTGDGTVPPPTSYAIVTALLGGAEEDADIARIRQTHEAYGHAPAATAFDVLQAALEDEDLAMIRDAYDRAGLLEEEMGPEGMDMALALLQAIRQTRRAAERKGAAEAALPATGLASDANLLQALTDLDQAIRQADDSARAILDDVRAALENGDRPVLPEMSGHDAAAQNGMAALDAALIPPMLAAARAGDEPARSAILALYAEYESLLVANPAIDPNAPAALNAVHAVQNELRAMVAPDLDLHVAAMPLIEPGQIYEIRIEVGSEGLEPLYEIEGADGVEATRVGGELRLTGIGGEARDLIVRASADTEAGPLDDAIEVRIRPVGDGVRVLIRGRVVDADGPVAGARVELRIDHLEGEVAHNVRGEGLEMVTDANGEFEMLDVLPGEYALVVVGHEDEANVHLTVDAETRPELEVELDLE